MEAQTIGMIATPAQGNKLYDNYIWCADNGCYSQGDKFQIDKYIDWLDGLGPFSHNCRFATAPDVVGDPIATLERSLPALPLIRQAGYPAALVAQDGLEHLSIPWDEFDSLFIGGSTEWKLSKGAAGLVEQAKDRGKWAHMGRVNSRKRFQYADAIGCDSVDGTFLVFGPHINLKRLLGWISELEGQGVLAL